MKAETPEAYDGSSFRRKEETVCIVTCNNRFPLQ